MSTDVSAYVVFGVKLPKDFLWDVKYDPRCPHVFSSKFCPECGQSAERKASKIPKPLWNRYRDTYGELSVIDRRDSEDHVIIGSIVGVVSTNNCQPSYTVVKEPTISAAAIADVVGVLPEEVRTYLVMMAM